MAVFSSLVRLATCTRLPLMGFLRRHELLGLHGAEKRLVQEIAMGRYNEAHLNQL
jgi:hypothetical protein